MHRSHLSPPRVKYAFWSFFSLRINSNFLVWARGEKKVARVCIHTYLPAAYVYKNRKKAQTFTKSAVYGLGLFPSRPQGFSSSGSLWRENPPLFSTSISVTSDKRLNFSEINNLEAYAVAQIREQMSGPDLHVFTLKFLALKKRFFTFLGSKTFL